MCVCVCVVEGKLMEIDGSIYSWKIKEIKLRCIFVGNLGAQVSLVKERSCWVQSWVFPVQWRR